MKLFMQTRFAYSRRMVWLLFVYYSTKYEKALMLTGTGANGKSVLMNLFQCFIGQENICHHDLQAFKKTDCNCKSFR